MKAKDDFIKAAKLASDISILYDLSLAAGQSLDLKSNCEQFVRTLMVRKNLVYAAVWIKEQFLSPDDAAVRPDKEGHGISQSDESDLVHLVYASPKFRIREKTLSLDHPVFSLLEDRKVYSLGSSEARFSEIVTEKKIKKGAFAVFALGQLGLLKLFSMARTTPFSEQELNQLQIVVAKFTLSLEANLAHQKIIREVSARKRAEEALRRSEERHRTLIENLMDGIAVVDLDERFILANPAAHRIFGVPLGKLQGHSLRDFMDQEQFVFIREQTKLRKNGEESRYDFEIIRPDGEKRVLLVNATPKFDHSGDLAGTFGVFHDITESRRMEKVHHLQFQIANAVHTTQDLFELFHQIRHRLSPILNTENFFIALYDKEKDTFTLPFFEDEKDNFQTFPAGRTLTAYVVRNDKALLVTNDDIRKFEESGEVDRVGSPSKIWLGVPLKVGREITGALVVQNYTDRYAYDEMDLEILKFVSNQIGISIERKRAEEALKSSEERYRIVTDQTGQLIYDCDLRTGNIEWSGAIEAVTGHTSKEFQSVNNDRWKKMIHPEDLDMTVKLFDELQNRSMKYLVEYRFHTKSGDYINIQDEGVFISDEHGQVYRLLGAMKDISERKRAELALRDSEEQLRQSQKMEAVGRLAGGVAHDLNNLLTGVTGYGDLLDNKIPDNSPLSKYVHEIQKAAKRAASLIGQLLAFSRKQVLQPKVLSLNDTVQDMEDMLRQIIGQDIDLITSFDKRLEYVKADPGQMQQVIMNLAVNARDAMPDGGTLTIETSNVTLDTKGVKQNREMRPGNYVMIVVSDNGMGMDKKILPQIFEPFFTTKEVGKGTGLGLSTIYGIIKQSGGDIQVYSKPKQGTTFKIYLPCVNKDRQDADTDRSTIKFRQGTETILVVEDEDVVRELTQDILEKCGYRILLSKNGEEALSLCERYSGPIHLLLTDIVMPIMNGRELAERITTQRPEIRVLFISGYPNDSNGNYNELESDTQFLQKPFSFDALAAKVRQVLDIGVVKQF